MRERNAGLRFEVDQCMELTHYMICIIRNKRRNRNVVISHAIVSIIIIINI